jgi:hypothetical protein
MVTTWIEILTSFIIVTDIYKLTVLWFVSSQVVVHIHICEAFS